MTDEEKRLKQLIRMKQWHAKNKEQQKSYRDTYNSNNRELVNAAAKRRREQNPELCKARGKRYRDNHNEEKNLRDKIWRQENPHKVAVSGRFRHSRLKQAIPIWYEDYLVKQLYKKRDQLNKRFNATLRVDHIIPLVSDTVCGLHCWANLQLLDGSLNSSKGNSYQQDW